MLNLNGLEAGACDGAEANECFCALCSVLYVVVVFDAAHEQTRAMAPLSSPRTAKNVGSKWWVEERTSLRLDLSATVVGASARHLRDLRKPEDLKRATGRCLELLIEHRNVPLRSCIKVSVSTSARALKDGEADVIYVIYVIPTLLLVLVLVFRIATSMGRLGRRNSTLRT